MSRIVESYIKLNEMFQKCMYNQLNGDFSFDDMRVYYVLLDDFVKMAREYYSNETLDLASSIELFNSDSAAQDELRQYKSDANNESKMSRIVESYIKFNEMSQECDQCKGEWSFYDEMLYDELADNFVKVAREQYSNETLDLKSAIELFNFDQAAQDELMQYEIDKFVENKRKSR